MSDPFEPKTFKQAWWHPDLEARENWHDGIRQEFNKMTLMGVWRNVRFQVDRGWLDAIGYSKLSTLESIKPDW